MSRHSRSDRWNRPASSGTGDVLGEEFDGVLGCDKHGDAYFRFMTTPGVAPTNNLAEQAIRFVVIDRRVTQGTRSERGRAWSERIWTVIATCAQQGRSVFDYLRDAITAHFNGRPIPALIA